MFQRVEAKGRHGFTVVLPAGLKQLREEIESRGVEYYFT